MRFEIQVSKLYSEQWKTIKNETDLEKAIHVCREQNRMATEGESIHRVVKTQTGSVMYERGFIDRSKYEE